MSILIAMLNDVGVRVDLRLSYHLGLADVNLRNELAPLPVALGSDELINCSFFHLAEIDDFDWLFGLWRLLILIESELRGRQQLYVRLEHLALLYLDLLALQRVRCQFLHVLDQRLCYGLQFIHSTVDVSHSFNTVG